MKKTLSISTSTIKHFKWLFIIPVLTSGLLLLSCSRNIDVPSNDTASSAANKEIATLSGFTINVTSVGAVGDGIVDDTKAFQKAIDSVAAQGGGLVYVPTGNYLIDADASIKMKSHVDLYMVDSTAQLTVKPTASGRFYAILIANVTDVTITGGKILGDRNTHLGTTGEQGMGIAVYGSDHVNIIGTRISNCWGDGITIASRSQLGAINPSSFVNVKKVICNNNRRQGLTIGKSNNITIDSCEFTYTNGTDPEAGIDIEPDTDTAEYITITNCIIAYNQDVGIIMHAYLTPGPKNHALTSVQHIEVHNNYIHHNKYGGYLIGTDDVQFNYNRIVANMYGPPVYAAGDATNYVLTPNTYN